MIKYCQKIEKGCLCGFLVEMNCCLSVTGGVPRYLEEVNPAQSATENIRRMAFRRESLLRTDFDEMFKDVITRKPRMAAKILEVLVDGPLTVSEISPKIDASVGGMVISS